MPKFIIPWLNFEHKDSYFAEDAKLLSVMFIYIADFEKISHEYKV